MRKLAIIATALLIAVTAAQAQRRITPREYIDTYKHLALEDMDIYGIPASITMAQGLLESDCGNSRLAVEANNHFGIKCKSNWTGQSILHDDDAPGECFRKYASAEESYRDHSEFLDKSERYEKLFELDIMDYKGWAHGLREAGYATNPRYAELLIKIIEENQLYLLDVQWLEADNTPLVSDSGSATGEPDDQYYIVFTPERSDFIDIDNYVVSVTSVGGYPVYFNNGSEFVIARAGDTYETLAQKTGVRSKRLRKFNDADAGMQPKAGEPVYIRAKLNRATNGKLLHTAGEGESLRDIAQRYGIKLSKLAGINRRSPESVFIGGEQIRLM